MRRAVTAQSIAKSTNMPLPGHYPVVTLQLNYTRYNATGLSKAICVVREPVEGIELDRWVIDLSEDNEGTDTAVCEGVLEAILKILYLQTGISSRVRATPTN